MHQLSKTTRTGYTLVELLVVIGIISVLMAIIIPVYAQARAKGRETVCLNNQRQLTQLALLQMQDNDGKMPGADFWTTTNIDQKLVHCPANGKPGANNYIYNARVAGIAQSALLLPTRTPVIADGKTVDHIGRINDDIDFRHSGSTTIAAYADGHIARSRKEEVDLHFPGDLFNSTEDVKNFLGIEVIPISSTFVTPQYQGYDVVRRCDVKLGLPILLRELSLYTRDMLCQRIDNKVTGAPVIDRIFLTNALVVNKVKYDVAKGHSNPDFLPDDVQKISPYDGKYINYWPPVGPLGDRYLVDPELYFFKGPSSGVSVIMTQGCHSVQKRLEGIRAHRYNLQFRTHTALFLALREWGGLDITDNAWFACNPPQLQYGQESVLHGSEHNWRIDESCITSGCPAEINNHLWYHRINDVPSMLSTNCSNHRYADQISIYATLMVDPVYLQVRADFDKYIAQKCTLMQQALAQHEPQMDANYWNFLKKVDIPINQQLGDVAGNSVRIEPE